MRCTMDSAYGLSSLPTACVACLSDLLRVATLLLHASRTARRGSPAIRYGRIRSSVSGQLCVPPSSAAEANACGGQRRRVRFFLPA